MGTAARGFASCGDSAQNYAMPARQLLGLFLSFIIAATALGEHRGWKLTPEERRAALMDPQRRAERVDRYKSQFATADAKIVDVVDGRFNPELFTRLHLLEKLVELTFVSSLSQGYRDRVRRTSSDLFGAAGEWEAFAEIAAPLAESISGERALRTAAAKGTSSAEGNRRRAELLKDRPLILCSTYRKATQMFGEERFLKMLYETVARDLSSVFYDSNIRISLEKDESCR
jgi:hypothetical protein